MPWKECHIMDERVKFIARLLDGEAMTGLCEEFSISRKTGYKILQRYRDCGIEGLNDRSRRPYRHANQLPVQIETLIVRSDGEIGDLSDLNSVYIQGDEGRRKRSCDVVSMIGLQLIACIAGPCRPQQRRQTARPACR
jgi:hypothetical protein